MLDVFRTARSPKRESLARCVSRVTQDVRVPGFHCTRVTFNLSCCPRHFPSDRVRQAIRRDCLQHAYAGVFNSLRSLFSTVPAASPARSRQLELNDLCSSGSWQPVCRVRMVPFALCSTNRAARSCAVRKPASWLAFTAMSQVTTLTHHGRFVLCNLTFFTLSCSYWCGFVWFACISRSSSVAPAQSRTVPWACLCVLPPPTPKAASECEKALQLCEMIGVDSVVPGASHCVVWHANAQLFLRSHVQA